MLVYMVYDKKTGAIVHVHRAQDDQGRSLGSTEEEILSALPAGVSRDSVGIVPTELDQVPSSRAMTFSVDVAKGALLRTPVRAPAQATRRRA